MRFAFRQHSSATEENPHVYEVVERTKTHSLAVVQEKHVCILHSRATANIFVDALNRQFREGVVEGMTRFAWWKDGVEYVGTCGTKLKQAIEDVMRESN